MLIGYYFITNELTGVNLVVFRTTPPKMNISIYIYIYELEYTTLEISYFSYLSNYIAKNTFRIRERNIVASEKNPWLDFEDISLTIPSPSKI